MSIPRICVRNCKLAATGLTDIVQVITSRDLARERYDATLDEMRVRSPLPPVRGTADMYGYHQSLLIAHHLDYSPRPVVQSYAAYTPRLADLDAQRLVGEAAPANLFLDFDNFGDGRFPMLSDNTSFPEILSRYEPRPAAAPTKYPLLDKRRAPRAFSRMLLSSSTVHFGQSLDLAAPQNSLLWTTIKVHPTRLWRLAAVVYKPPVLWIDVTTRDGALHTYRLISSMAEEGFILSPLVENSQDFLDLYSLKTREKPGANEVDRVSISARDAAWNRPFFETDIDVNFYRLQFSDH